MNSLSGIHPEKGDVPRVQLDSSKSTIGWRAKSNPLDEPVRNQSKRSTMDKKWNLGYNSGGKVLDKD